MSTIHGRGDDCEGVFESASSCLHAALRIPARSFVSSEDLRWPKETVYCLRTFPFSRFLKKPDPSHRTRFRLNGR